MPHGTGMRLGRSSVFLVLFSGMAMLAYLLLPISETRSALKNLPSGSGARVKTGAEILLETNFGVLAGKRVGLVVNQTATVETAHLIDILHRATNLSLVAIFVPEHGARGTLEAGAAVGDERDATTGLPVFSLYGERLAPTKEALRGIDVLLYDMQDVGVRYYTFISTMGLAMQAAAEAGIAFVVLDRPNPLGGEYVSGFVAEPGNLSFVGLYQIPIAHGLTVGELSQLIKGRNLLPGLEKLDLTVVSMEGWQRWMRWPDTRLPWAKTSPNIIDFNTALVYAGVGLFEATGASDGRGTTTPFTVLGAPWTNGRELARALNARRLPGVTFTATRFTPQRIKGMASSPTLEGRKVEGIRIIVVDTQKYLPVETGIHILDAFYRQAISRGQYHFLSRVDWLDKIAGTRRLHQMLISGNTPEQIINAWKQEVAMFGLRREKYLLY
jgi:uncharacterized protein YbbC (DUF1343 family)